MDKVKLNLETWEVDVQVNVPQKEGPPKVEMQKQEYPLKDNLSQMLRTPGLFKTTEDTVEAIILAKAILNVEGNEETIHNSIDLNKKEVEIIKTCLDRHLAAAVEGRGMFGGPIHEPLILRIHELWKEVEGK